MSLWSNLTERNLHCHCITGKYNRGQILANNKVLNTNFEIVKKLRCYLTVYMDSLFPSSPKNQHNEGQMSTKLHQRGSPKL